MTWKQRQALGLCQYPCAAESSDGDYCERHAEAKNDRNRIYMRRTRAFLRVQLGLFG
jgi:hypothetical protein